MNDDGEDDEGQDIEGDLIDFFRHLFPEDLTDGIVYTTTLYALQKGKAIRL